MGVCSFHKSIQGDKYLWACDYIDTSLPPPDAAALYKAFIYKRQ